MKIFYAASFSLMVGIGLSSCFVDGSGGKTIKLPAGPISLPIYQYGDSLKYAFRGTRNSATDPLRTTSTSGTIEQSWTIPSPPLIDPLTKDAIVIEVPATDENGNPIEVNGIPVLVTVPLLKEITEIKFDDDFGNNKTVRYISQDTTGGYYVHAIEGGLISTPTGTEPELFWINSNKTVTIPPSIVKSVQMYSPIIENTANILPLKFKIIKDCSETNQACNNNIKEISENYHFTRRDTISTINGDFETVVLNYNTLSAIDITSASGHNITMKNIDIRASCDTAFQSSIGDTEVYIHPDIGIVAEVINCNGNDTSFSFLAELTSVGGNITIPEN